MDIRIPWEITELILAHLEGSATEEQQQELENWLKASPRHKYLYEKVCKPENLDSYRQTQHTYSYISGYREFCRHVTEVKRRKWRRRVQYVAGILIPLLLSGWWIWQQNSSVSLPQGSIVPGKYQAILTLPGGETLHLTQEEKTGRLEKTNAYFDADTLRYEAVADAGKEVFHRITIPRGGEYMLKLADGTRVWLNAESELSYPAVFTADKRRVLLKGEAYFQVSSDSVHPFVVETGDQSLTVLGTSFGIRAYEGEEKILTTLEKGKVRIEAYHQQVILHPGEQSRLEDRAIQVEKVNTSLYTAWHKGMFMFCDQPLEDILHTLARWYNIDVVYQHSGIEKIRFNGELPRYGDIRTLLDKIEMLEKVRFQIEGRRVTVLKY